MFTVKLYAVSSCDATNVSCRNLLNHSQPLHLSCYMQEDRKYHKIIKYVVVFPVLSLAKNRIQLEPDCVPMRTSLGSAIESGLGNLRVEPPVWSLLVT